MKEGRWWKSLRGFVPETRFLTLFVAPNRLAAALPRWFTLPGQCGRGDAGACPDRSGPDSKIAFGAALR